MSNLYPFQEDFSNDFIGPVDKGNIEAFDLKAVVSTPQKLPTFFRQNFVALLTGTAENVTVRIVLSRLRVGKHSVGIVNQLKLRNWAGVSSLLTLFVHVALLKPSIALPRLKPLPCHKEPRHALHYYRIIVLLPSHLLKSLALLPRISSQLRGSCRKFDHPSDLLNAIPVVLGVDAAELPEVRECLAGRRTGEEARPGHQHPRLVPYLHRFEILHAGQDLNRLPVVLRDEVESPREGQLQGRLERAGRLGVFGVETDGGLVVAAVEELTYLIQSVSHYAKPIPV